MGTGKNAAFPTHPTRRRSIFLHDHFNPRDGRRAEGALSAEFLPGEAPLPEQEASSNPMLTLNDR